VAWANTAGKNRRPWHLRRETESDVGKICGKCKEYIRRCTVIEPDTICWISVLENDLEIESFTRAAGRST
jgi:hypothetical protein